ncbi:glycosyltransferase family 39 protein [Candidatus Daviesbacteria bacterium]|nr:glycosyltransferase family 39 protein [Candidatus Daviesbacteria bacterium]
MRFRGTSKSLIFILFIATVIRFINLNQSLWLDEAINIQAAKQLSLLDLVTKYAVADFHPPGYLIILWSWIRVLDSSEIWVRVPSVVFGILTIFVIYRLVKKLISNNVALLAALLLAINPLHIYYSQEARMYAFAAFAVCLNVLFFIGLLRGEKYSFIGFSLSSLLVLSADYLAMLIFPAQLIYLFMNRLKNFREWFGGILIGLLPLIWWFPIFLDQIKGGISTAEKVPGWREVVGSSGLKSIILTYIKFIIGRISIDNDFIYALVFLPIGLLFAALLFLGFKSSWKEEKRFLIIWAVVSITFAWAISLFVPVFNYFRMLFVLPPFLILVSLGVSGIKGRLKYLTITLVFLVELVSYLVYLGNPVFQREDWRGAVSFLKMQGNSQIFLESNSSFAPLEYYAHGNLIGTGALKKFPANSTEDLIDLEHVLADHPPVFLLDYLVEISDPNRLVDRRLTEIGYVKTNSYNFNGVGLIYEYKWP